MWRQQFHFPSSCSLSLCIACSAHSVWMKLCADWPPSRAGVVGSFMACMRPCAVSHTVLPFISWCVFGFSLFGFCEQRCCERVCTSFYVSMFSVLMSTHPSQHRTARWHIATQVEVLKTGQFSKAAVCCLFPSLLRSMKVLLSRHPHQHLKGLCVFVEHDHLDGWTGYPSMLPDLLFVGVGSYTWAQVSLQLTGSGLMSSLAAASWLLESQGWVTLPSLLLTGLLISS